MNTSLLVDFTILEGETVRITTVEGAVISGEVVGFEGVKIAIVKDGERDEYITPTQIVLDASRTVNPLYVRKIEIEVPE